MQMKAMAVVLREGQGGEIFWAVIAGFLGPRSRTRCFFQGVKISQRDSVTWSINFYCLAAMQLDRVETRLSFYLKCLGFSLWLVMLSSAK